jgi:hypothetical protein
VVARESGLAEDRGPTAGAAGGQAARDEGPGSGGRRLHPPCRLLRPALIARGHAHRPRHPRRDDRAADRRPGCEGRAPRSCDCRFRVRPACHGSTSSHGNPKNLSGNCGTPLPAVWTRPRPRWSPCPAVTGRRTAGSPFPRPGRRRRRGNQAGGRWKPRTTGCPSCASLAPGPRPRRAPALTAPPCACPKALRSFRRPRPMPRFTSGSPPPPWHCATRGRRDADPLQADLAAIATAQGDDRALRCANAPGFAQTLCRPLRRDAVLPPHPASAAGEAAVEARVRAALGEDIAASAAARQGPARLSPVQTRAPLARPAHPVAQRGHRRREPPDRRRARGSGRGKDRPRARRRKADQADRNDSFILHKFEAILSMTEFLNLNRRVEDDDEDTARRPPTTRTRSASPRSRRPPPPA